MGCAPSHSLNCLGDRFLAARKCVAIVPAMRLGRARARHPDSRSGLELQVQLACTIQPTNMGYNRACLTLTVEGIINVYNDTISQSVAPSSIIQIPTSQMRKCRILQLNSNESTGSNSDSALNFLVRSGCRFSGDPPSFCARYPHQDLKIKRINIVGLVSAAFVAVLERISGRP